MTTRDLLELAEETARAAGRLMLAERTWGVEVAATKSSPTDVVTAVDIASERLIRSRLLTARPTDGFVGEEGEDVPTRSGVTWVVDPIDGTVNYLYGLRQSAVSIAACRGEQVLVGVVHHPASGETFTAAAQEGAWCDGQRMSPSGCTDVSRALVGIGFHYRAEVRARQAVEVSRLVPVVRDVRRLGAAALDLCYVGAGRLDAYVERGLKPWDLAAGGLVAREAGVRVEGMDGRPAGELIVVAAPDGLFPHFHAALVSAGFADWPLPDWP
ncbi:MAG TPA: inositol monophosphatase family protein [Nocardioidaceae bacterium]|nr:inositol monophosphatase family protein [Nocardioidaceae bacterium]